MVIVHIRMCLVRMRGISAVVMRSSGAHHVWYVGVVCVGKLPTATRNRQRKGYILTQCFIRWFCRGRATMLVGRNWSAGMLPGGEFLHITALRHPWPRGSAAPSVASVGLNHQHDNAVILKHLHQGANLDTRPQRFSTMLTELECYLVDPHFGTGLIQCYVLPEHESSAHSLAFHPRTVNCLTLRRNHK